MIPMLRCLVAVALTAGTAFSGQAQLGPPQRRPDFVRIGVNLNGSNLVLTQVDVNWNTTSTVSVPILQSTNLVELRDHPAVSPDDSSAAIPVPTNAGGVLVYVRRNIRAPRLDQMRGYWLPVRDPATSDTEIRMVSPPRFLNAEELWVLEGIGNGRATRLARYHLGPTRPDFLGASDLVRTYANPGIACRDWLIHDGRAVVLQQRDEASVVTGIDVLCYGTDGIPELQFPVNDNGLAFHQPAIIGIAPVPAHPEWGFLQYSVGNVGRTVAQFIDLASGALTAASDDFSSKVGRISSDGTLALFRDPLNLLTLRPVKMPTQITGQVLDQLPPVAEFFCSDGGDSVAVDGGYLVSAPSASGGTGPGCDVVHRTRLDAAGQLEIVEISTNTGRGPFLFQSGGGGPSGVDWPTFVYPGMNRLYNLLPGPTPRSLVHLDATSMTYGPETMTLSASTPMSFF